MGRESIMLTAKDVAEYFLASSGDEGQDLISNLKLQKLVYYAQGVNLALYDEPLFHEEIEAWMHGPVVPSLYHDYKVNGDKAIEPPTDIDYTKYSQQEREVLDEVYSFFGQFSAWKLRNMTHEERPWKEANENGCGVITHSAMREYFKTVVSHG